MTKQEFSDYIINNIKDGTLKSEKEVEDFKIACIRTVENLDKTIDFMVVDQCG